MSSRRLNQRKIINNSSDNIQGILKSKNLKFIRHLSTAKFKYPTDSEMSKFNIISETWKLGDRMYKYSYNYYGDSELWWIIAWFNKKPTDAHFKIGQPILIPTPLEKLYEFFEV